MWIEIYDKLENRKDLVNAANVTHVNVDDRLDVRILFNVDSPITHLFGAEWYDAITMALQGQSVDLGDLGHVKPLKNSQREEIAKRLNYLDAVEDRNYPD